jgi:hypothetical protein
VLNQDPRKRAFVDKLVALPDKEALEALRSFGQQREQLANQKLLNDALAAAVEEPAIYRNKVEAAILALFIGAKHSSTLNRIDINRKLSSDFPLSDVSRILTKLVKEGLVVSNRVYQKGKGYTTVYSVVSTKR